MEQSRVIIRYHNKLMLMTLDFTTLVGILLDVYGAPLDLRFEPMSSDEREETSESVDGTRAVRERFWILGTTGGRCVRREDLERQAMHYGQK